MLPAVHERPDIHIAQRDHSIERRFHHTIALHSFEPRHVRFRGRDVAALHADGLLERLNACRLRLILGLILIVILP